MFSRALVSPRNAIRAVAVALAAASLLLAAAGSAGAQQPSLNLAPASGTSVLGTTFSITATFSPASPGTLIRFQISAGPNAGEQAAIAMNAVGQATFTYVGDGGVGTDGILAYADIDGDASIDGSELVRIATRDWVQGSTASGLTLSPVVDSNAQGTSHELTATVSPVSAGVLVRFEVLAGPNVGDRFSASSNSNGVARGSYVGDGGVGTDVIIAWIDLDGDSNRDGNEPSAVAQKTWTAAATVAGITLSPANASNAVGTNHELTATVSPARSGVLVRFEVIAGPNVGDRFNDDTNSNGVARDSYRGDSGAGTDVVIAWADLDRDGARDSGEPSASATKVWVPATVSSIKASPTSASNPTGASHTVKATVSPAVSGVTVQFRVLAGPNSGDQRSATTNGSGVASASYVGDGGTGTDVILVWADLDRDNQPDAGEPAVAVTKTWTTAAPAQSRLIQQVHNICASATRADHPALPVLCGIIDGLPQPAQDAIGRIILRLADRDDDDDRRGNGNGRGHGHDDDDDDD